MKLTRGEKTFNVFNYIFLFFLSALFLLPFYFVFVGSFVSAAEAARRGLFIAFPEKFSLTAYQIIFSKGSAIIHSYGITLFRVLVGTTLNLVVTSSFAYVLSKKQLPGRTALTLMVFFTMLFNGGLIPYYLLVKSLGLLDTVWSLIIPQLVNAWWLLIMRNFFYTIPSSLEEAAIIDGATPLTILLRVIVPLSLPAFATIGLFYAVWHWNDWFQANIFIQDISRMPVQNILQRVLSSTTARLSDQQVMDVLDNPPPPEALKDAVIIVATLPILFVYPFVQKYFVKGVLIGSVKG